MSMAMSKNVTRFDGCLVSKDGTVYRNYYGNWVEVQKTWNTKTKRMEVVINYRTWDLAELVYIAFNGNYDNYWFILDFKDNDKTNCSLDNLVLSVINKEAYIKYVHENNIDDIKLEQEQEKKRIKELLKDRKNKKRGE